MGDRRVTDLGAIVYCKKATSFTNIRSNKCKNKFLQKLVPINEMEEEIESDEEFDPEGKKPPVGPSFFQWLDAASTTTSDSLGEWSIRIEYE